MVQDTRRRDAISLPDEDELGSRAYYKRTFKTLQGSRPLETVTINGKTYTEGDDDGRNNLVEVAPSALSSEEQRRFAARYDAMLGSPVGAGLYGIAAIAGASPRSRDLALAAGTITDGVMMGVAPRGAVPVQLEPLPRQQPVAPNRQPALRYGEANADGQASYGYGWLTEPMLGTGQDTYKRLQPPGWRGHGTRYREARGHLIARSLGGEADDLRKIVTLTQNGPNNPQMSSFEGRIAKRVRNGEVIAYSSIPLYDPEALRPSSVLVTAVGSQGRPTARLIPNPPYNPDDH
jgi:hypothetical protein